MRSIMWFRRDLRVLDNRALASAAKDSQQVVGVFFVVREQWANHHDSPDKIYFWLKNLQTLKDSLERLNIPLLVFSVSGFSDIPAELVKIAETYHCQRLYFNFEYEINELARDKQVELRLRSSSIDCFCFHDRLLIQPGKVVTGEGKPYTVFTPFRNNWAKQILKQDLQVLSIPAPQREVSDIQSTDLKKILKDFRGREIEPWKAGEEAANDRLRKFLTEKVNQYDQQRDIPSIDGTSMLSPYLSAGVVSIRQCFKSLLEAFNSAGKLPDFNTSMGNWLNELIWRDFYSHVLVAFPRVSMGIPFQLSTLHMNWQNDDNHYQQWKEGLTGYPIVDAAMRQLKDIGWMHNRLRMVSAMFLSKHLLLDWRKGERWFMENLIDGELAANNGGWQWSASTGTDAAPYFRVFNPFSQSKRFDAKAEFIKKYCPELESVVAKALHDPELLRQEIKRLKLNYPEPIVDHAQARKRAIEAFKQEK